MIRYIKAPCIVLLLLFVEQVSAQAIPALKTWLSLDVNSRPSLITQAFSGSPLTKKQCTEAVELLMTDKENQLRASLSEEWNKKAIHEGDHELKFEYKVFGEKPKGGRSLFISMHGGGNAAPRVNDQQWQNQIGLYKPAEGVYVAPRAPTNTWNLWHEQHIDSLFEKLIEAAVIFENVNPDRVYIMGYSAGGDGVYQLAPRMADHWAAASMMAGHPNETSPLSLRNLPFAVPWMASFTRNTIPEKIIWKQDDVHHDSFYWLAIPAESAKTGAEIVASYKGNEINVEKNYSDTLILYLNDRMMNLDKTVAVIYEGQKIFNAKLHRSMPVIYQTIADRKDPGLVFTAKVTIVNGKVLEK